LEGQDANEHASFTSTFLIWVNINEFDQDYDFTNPFNSGVIPNHTCRLDILHATHGHTVSSPPLLVSDHHFHSYWRDVCHLLVYEEVAFVAKQTCGLEEDKTAPRRRRASGLRKGTSTVYTQCVSRQSIGR
jgi:hypothetical protein